MARIIIKRDEQGNVSVTGNPDPNNGYYQWALRKVLEGKYTEISWEPIRSPLELFSHRS